MLHKNSIEAYRKFWWDSTAGKFRQQMSAYAKIPNDIHYVFYDEFEKICHGGFSLAHGQLNFLTDE